MHPDHVSTACAALADLDCDALVALYAADAVFEDPALGQTVTGREALRAYFTNLFSLDGVGFSDVVGFACGDSGAAQWTWTAAGFVIRGASIFELGPGGIQRETIYYDPRPALRDAEDGGQGP